MLTDVPRDSTRALISSVRILAVFRETRVLAWTGRLNTRREWGALRPVFGGLETAPEQGSTGHGTFKPAKRLLTPCTWWWWPVLSHTERR